jgi:hypothetical protein
MIKMFSAGFFRVLEVRPALRGHLLAQVVVLCVEGGDQRAGHAFACFDPAVRQTMRVRNLGQLNRPGC